MLNFSFSRSLRLRISNLPSRSETREMFKVQFGCECLLWPSFPSVVPAQFLLQCLFVERKRERERDRQTDGRTDRQTDREGEMERGC